MYRDLDNLKSLMGSNDADLIAKALTVSSGFVGINLEQTAKLLLPLYAGLRNRLPADRPKMGGTSAQWRMQLGYGSFGFGAAASFGTAFGATGPDVTDNSTTIGADYKTQAVKGSVQFEAIPMAQGYDDPMAIETSMTLSTLIRLEELITLGGNTAAISAPVPTGNYSSAHAVGTYGVGAWTVKVTALTLQGSITNASGNSAVGESTAGSVVITVPAAGADYLDVSWPAVEGAVGYKVYVNAAAGGGAGATYLLNPLTSLKYCDKGTTPLATTGGTITVPSGQTYVTVNHVQLWAVGVNTDPTPPSLDGTANANVFEGLISWAEKSTVYGQSLTGRIIKDMDGGTLTTAGSGVSEFDYILQQLWTQWVINPTLIVCSPASTSNLTDKLIAANNAAMYRLEIAPERGSFTGGVFVGGYLNKYAASLMGQQPATIPVWAHPYMPDGTFLFLSERIPYQYSREARGFALDVQTPYTYFELARSDRSFPFSTFWTETLKCYHPIAQSAIVGARVA
jgi:hypothetical protein